jgi:probable H4MPT-linked C1 transfer pathway protein
MSGAVIGWDVGGVNTKAARVMKGKVLATRTRQYEVQRDPAALGPLLRALAHELGACEGEPHALTMTAELSQMFRTKREGVHWVLDAIGSAFPHSAVHVYTVDGCFLTPDAARDRALDVAAANWAATARVVAGAHPDGILVDTGSTTTDIIPIVRGAVVARGRTDPERLRSGELVYLGAVRTPIEAIVHEVPWRGAMAGVSAEGFALVGDVQVWRGELEPAEYSAPTPDGRPASRDFARERLARVVCADRELLDDADIDAIAEYVAECAEARIASSLTRVRREHPHLELAVVTGLGDFLGARAARRAGLRVVRLAEQLGADAARVAPAAAVALLLEETLGGHATTART